MAGPLSSPGDTIDITAFGANGDDAIDDTAAIRAAVDALQENDVLLVPESSQSYTVTSTANFAIDEPGVKVMVRGHILMTGAPTPSNHLFVVTADRCSFIGQGGVLEGSGSYITGSDADDPALIRFYIVEGCSVRGLRLRNGPRFSIMLRQTSWCAIRDCVFEGGPTAYAFQHHGIFLWGASDIQIRGNRFVPGEDGGKTGSWIGSTSTSSNIGISILNNQFGSSYDHAVYTTGLFYSVIANNITSDIGGTALKTAGANNVIANNNLYSAHSGGIEIRNSSRCVVANNLVQDFGFVAVQASILGGGGGAQGVYAENLISGNTLLARDVSPVYEGIRVLAETNCSRTKITGNLIVGAGGDGGTPAITVSSGEPSYSVTISGNTLDQCPADGIAINHVNASIISDNIIRSATGGVPFQQSNVTETNLVTDNIYGGLFPPLAIQSITQGENQSIVQWNMGIGESYRVGWSENLQQWTDQPVGATDTWTDTNTTESANKFYRVVEE